ncbi:MAG: 3-dehydroquinate synthase [Cellulomonadaceae bacterium]|jgi:3-dehydroquinate synthase|nr:3-dehydroquinate synthase [Cellulomonadaceae bacterium]
MTERVTVHADTPYDVVIGRDLYGWLPAMVGKATRVLIVVPAVLTHYGTAVREVLTGAGYETYVAEVPDAEAQKTVHVAEFCWSVLGQCGFTRTDAVVAVGGGATTDLGGWVAATWLRGIRVVHVATTVLGMVDAAVGGKTGINTSLGKNLVGSFHTPAGVICDTSMLDTLSERDYVAGLAEVIKTGFIADTRILELIEEALAESDPGVASDAVPLSCDDAPAEGLPVSARLNPVLPELIQRSVAVKAAVVSEDFTEQGSREFLNYGHTLGHAIEHHEDFQWRHGEAVAVGMVFAAELAQVAGMLDASVVARTRALCSAVGLPTTYDGAWEDLQDAMQRDKKTRGHMLRFIVLTAAGEPTRLEGPSEDMLREAFARIAA